MECTHCTNNEERGKSEISTGEAQFTCPMHPEIVRNAPGNCPKCGMNLVPMEESASAGTSTSSCCG